MLQPTKRCVNLQIEIDPQFLAWNSGFAASIKRTVQFSFGAFVLEIAFGMKKEAEEVISAVEKVLAAGWRTADIADEKTPEDKKIGTAEMSAKVVAILK